MSIRHLFMSAVARKAGQAGQGSPLQVQAQASILKPGRGPVSHDPCQTLLRIAMAQGGHSVRPGGGSNAAGGRRLLTRGAASRPVRLE
jgi:hypothetical protein